MSRWGLGAAAALALAGCATSGRVGPTGAGLSPTEQAYQEGLEAKKAGKTDEAMTALRRSVAADPHHLDAWRALVQLSFESGRLAELTQELQARSATAPEDDALHYALGLADFAEASKAGGPALGELRRAAALRPAEPEYPFRLGVALLESERYSEALPPLRKAVELAPVQAKYRVPLGIVLAELGDRKGAMESFRSLLGLKPTARDVELVQKAMDQLLDPFRGFPKAEADNLQRGIAWMDRADAPQQAIDTFQDILDRYPDLSQVHALLGLCYERLDNSGEAVEELRRAIELAPDSPGPYLYLADLYAGKSKPARAEEYYRGALARNPLLDHAYARLGELAVLRGDAKEALADYQAYVTLRPNDPVAHKHMAQGYELAGQYEQAEAELAGVIARHPNDVDARMRQGYLYAALCERSPGAQEKRRYREQAIAAFQKVLDAQPENVAASRALQGLQESK